MYSGQRLRVNCINFYKYFRLPTRNFEGIAFTRDYRGYSCQIRKQLENATCIDVTTYLVSY